MRTQFVSLDPYMRNRLTAMKSYAQGVALGEVVVGETVGHVVESRNPAFEAGQTVIGSERVVEGIWGPVACVG